jgi:hypothetical protein
LKEQMLNAQRLKAKFIVKVWLVEARNGLFQVSDERKWTQEEVKKEHLIDYIIEKIGKDKLDFYLPENDFLIK